MRTIVSIGGGSIGRVNHGEKTPYETLYIDKKIVELSNKENPKLLFLGHGSEVSESYFNTIKENYGKLNCTCRHLKTKTLKNMDVVKEMINEADIIYVGSGNTKKLMSVWRESGLDELLINAYNNGKIMCGISCGAMCWYKYGLSDSLRLEEHDETKPLILVPGLDLIDAVIACHADIVLDQKKYLKYNLEDDIGLLLSNNCSLVIKDNTYEVVKKDNNTFIKKTHIENNELIEEEILPNGNINELIDRGVKNG